MFKYMYIFGFLEIKMHFTLSSKPDSLCRFPKFSFFLKKISHILFVPDHYFLLFPNHFPLFRAGFNPFTSSNYLSSFPFLILLTHFVMHYPISCLTSFRRLFACVVSFFMSKFLYVYFSA